ncbi:MAG: energy-coupled thiamine transporter ThiT [Coriobacteriia bacterium]|nr:energy-coupled thiamine transporter ThiT [Coriobacteriia bacterium]
MRSDRVSLLAEMALAVALSAALWLLGVKLPWNIAGGTVALDMLPIMVVGLRRGLVPGLITGALWGAGSLLLDPYIIHPVQLVFDYPLAFALCGLVGLGTSRVRETLADGKRLQASSLVTLLVILGGAGRFVSHFISGAVFFASNAPTGQPVLLFSAIYNLSYMIPSTLACAVLAVALYPVLERTVPLQRSVLERAASSQRGIS